MYNDMVRILAFTADVINAEVSLELSQNQNIQSCNDMVKILVFTKVAKRTETQHTQLYSTMERTLMSTEAVEQKEIQTIQSCIQQMREIKCFYF